MSRFSLAYIAVLFVCLSAFTGCKEKDEEAKKVDLSGVTLTVIVDPGQVTDSDGTSLYKYVWNEGDAVSAFFGYSNAITFITTATGTASGSFITISTGTYTENPDVEYFFKIHSPASDKAGAYTETVTSFFPNKVTASTKDDWSLDPLMVGSSKSSTIQIFGASSFLKFHVVNEGISSIAVLSNDSEKKLSGQVKYSFDASGYPYPSDVSAASNVVICNAIDGTFTPGKDYYFPVIPSDLREKGYTIIYYSKDGNKQVTVPSVSQAFERNKVFAIPQTDEDAGPSDMSGSFTTSQSGNMVAFALGNLQYDLAAKVWKTAENQYDFIGKAEGNINPLGTEGTIDLFAWSTTAQNSNWGISNILEPTDGYTDGTFKDWGANMIRDGWRTPSKYEMSYILGFREASKLGKTENARFAKATVCGVQGLLLFPDVVTWPEKVTLPVNINADLCDFEGNVYNKEEFTLIEKVGIVFLPCAGNRIGSTVDYSGTAGFYWTCSESSPTGACDLWFSPEGVASGNAIKRSNASAVRLISSIGDF